VDSHIRIREDSIPEDAAEHLVEMLTLNNVVREEMIRHGRKDEARELPEEIQMFEVVGEDVILPRGFASHLLTELDGFGVGISWQDRRTRASDFSIDHHIPLRDYQIKIYDAVIEDEQGIVQAPTGSGKTVAALAIIGSLDGHSVVIVNTKEIAQQWIDRCMTWLGEDFPVGMVGDGEFWLPPDWANQSLTIAINATLNSRFDQLKEDGFFERFVLACMDECHHANAETYKKVFSAFTSQWRFGMSATPEKTGDERIPYIVLGPEIIEITEEDVEDQVIKPTVKVIETEFECSFKNRRYDQVIAKLVRDEWRNALIAREITSNHQANANLLLSKQMKHFELLWDALVDDGYPEDQIFTIIGSDSRAQRKKIVERSEEANCVILSTLADEALDAPRLDRLHLAFPTSNPDLVRQQVGRIRRRHPEKKDAMVMDYRDRLVSVFNKQYMTRRHEVYDPLGFEVVKRK
jgi:superfamily II DNA or RNA helicase